MSKQNNRQLIECCETFLSLSLTHSFDCHKSSARLFYMQLLIHWGGLKL